MTFTFYVKIRIRLKYDPIYIVIKTTDNTVTPFSVHHLGKYF